MSTIAASGDQCDFHKKLRSHNYVVVPCLNDDILPTLRTDLAQVMQAFPEFRINPVIDNEVVYSDDNEPITNPAAFHNPVVRKIRQWAMAALVNELWHDYVGNFKEGSLLEQGFGCLYVNPNVNPDGNVTPRVLDNDELFYGFINLASSRAEVIIDDGEKIDVPPGHIYVAANNNTFEINTNYRLDLCWRLTYDTKPMVPTSKAALKTMLADQAVMKTGFLNKQPNFVNSKSKRSKIVVAALHSRCRANDETDYGRPLDSLHHCNLKLYPAYTSDEIHMHVPARSWSLLKPGKTSARHTVSLAN